MLADVALNTAAAAAELLPDITASFAGVIITDINMPGMSGLEFFNKIKEIDPDIPVILVTGHGDISMAVEAIRHGAYDFIEKPFSVDELVDITRRAMEKRSLTLENRQLRQDLADQDAPGPRILGKQPPPSDYEQRLKPFWKPLPTYCYRAKLAWVKSWYPAIFTNKAIAAMVTLSLSTAVLCQKT